MAVIHEFRVSQAERVLQLFLHLQRLTERILDGIPFVLFIIIIVSLKIWIFDEKYTFLWGKYAKNCDSDVILVVDANAHTSVFRMENASRLLNFFWLF